jgi:hypothetical protein
MEAIQGLDSLERRFERLRQVVSYKRLQLQWIEEDVRACFQENDMAGIAELAREKDLILAWISNMEKFIAKWEKYWQQNDTASGWLSAGIQVYNM